MVEVAPDESVKGVYPRLLCFAVSYSAQHQTRVRAVAETWGQRCDKLLFFSNMSDTIVVAANTSAERRYDVVQFDIVADHEHLWLRTRAALNYVHEHFRHDYDWFFKCDDDTYVIIENMRAYLKRPEILQRFSREPMQMGHRFNMPADAFHYYIRNETLRSMWHLRWDRMVYNSGGAGYAMNRLYLDKIVESLPEWTCLPDEASGIMPEDAGVAFCMMWNDVYPWDTRDHRGRERWHALNPEFVFMTWDDPNDWYVKYHKTVGGVRSKHESAAPDSVAFHYVQPPLMYHLERSLYFCRSEHNDIATFNKKFGLAIGDKVMTT
ncbi:Glycoprotein-N-acetylgalactosamine 3-beta-galactosyltransferase [Phytophthora megakarya]|uniref:N-acetylgalactosaminide beta-1,3-galactosyltransferase n=1 Tax=Phytophthora megakarya TaxID=4795 RepID=A0A225WVU1_9STRA|nr:Glycoprotein-N-acetylgalactosamine 3-beta-galactosyltransferase [Phytophthora megakarya]